jgi:hypothetical protein
MSLLSVLLLSVFLMGAGGEPYPSALTRSELRTVHEAAVSSGAGTIFSSESQYGAWNSVEVFVTGDVTPTSRMTVTAQVSMGDANWADAPVQKDSGQIAGSSVYSAVLTEDSTKVFRMPVIGTNLRFKIQKTDTVTPTIKIVLKTH